MKDQVVLVVRESDYFITNLCRRALLVNVALLGLTLLTRLHVALVKIEKSQKGE